MLDRYNSFVFKINEIYSFVGVERVLFLSHIFKARFCYDKKEKGDFKMKKILLPLFAFGLAFSVLGANAAEVSGKVVAKKDDVIHVQPTNSSTPKELKMTPETKYYQKEQKKSASAAEVDVNEFVEVIYSIDPKTNEPVIDEIIVLDLID